MYRALCCVRHAGEENDALCGLHSAKNGFESSFHTIGGKGDLKHIPLESKQLEQSSWRKWEERPSTVYGTAGGKSSYLSCSQLSLSQWERNCREACEFIKRKAGISQKTQIYVQVNLTHPNRIWEPSYMKENAAEKLAVTILRNPGKGPIAIHTHTTGSLWE